MTMLMAEFLVSVDLESVEKIHSDLVDRIAKDELNLPLLPHVATEVLNVTSDPDADIVNVAALIQQDQALASKVMKFSNLAT